MCSKLQISTMKNDNYQGWIQEAGGGGAFPKAPFGGLKPVATNENDAFQVYLEPILGL